MVKSILKRNDVLLSQFASDLNISRPTLDTYIKNYDSGFKIGNPLFQKIFDFLFSNLTISREEFHKRYSYVLNNFGKHHEIKNSESTLETLITDGSIKTYLSLDELNTLGNLIINKDVLLSHLLKVSLILDNKIELSSLSEKDKMLTIGMYEMSCKLTEGDYSYNQESYDKLENSLAKKQNDINKEELKQKLTESITSMVNEAIEKGNVELVLKLIQDLKQS